MITFAQSKMSTELNIPRKRCDEVFDRFFNFSAFPIFWHIFSRMAALLVDLDRGVDLADEEESRVEADGAGEQPEGHDHHEGVGEVQKGRNELFDVQLGVEVEDAVGENVDGWTSGHEEWSPPPVVVLCAQLEVYHDDADLGAGDDQDDEDQEEESEQVVELKWVVES